jgi:hypothetical protein
MGACRDQLACDMQAWHAVTMLWHHGAAHAASMQHACKCPFAPSLVDRLSLMSMAAPSPALQVPVTINTSDATLLLPNDALNSPVKLALVAVPIHLPLPPAASTRIGIDQCEPCDAEAWL